MRCSLSVIILLICSSASAQLSADFFAASTQGCSPLTVQFQDNSTGSPTSWFWDFGNGITSSAQNPLVTYTTGGNYSVRLIVRNAIGQDFKQKASYITVFATPRVNFIISSGDSGCVALQTVFKDTTNFFNAPVKNWQWDFGDGNASNQQNPTHTFSAEGKYNVTLTVRTTQGCSDSITRYAAIIAGNKPIANFSALPLNGCASVLRNFKNKSSGIITATAWDFGDGGTSFDKNPQYHYQDTGLFSVKLTVSENGCQDSIKIPNYIHIDGPAAKFLTFFNCKDRFRINFYDKSIGVFNRQWDFGDGQTSTNQNISHVYSSPGIYIISLIINGNICSDTARNTVHIKVKTPVLQVSPVKSFYCKYDTLRFATENYDTLAVKLFYWDFGDSVVRGSYSNSIIHSYNKAGNFIPTAFIRNKDGCTDTINFNSNIKVVGPNAGFSVDTIGCTNSVVKFKDTSTAAGSQITQWIWSYGDGITAGTKGSTNYNYAFPGAYNAKLSLTDANGCTDSITQIINIFPSPVVDAGIDTFTCAGGNIQLNPAGAATYVWQNNPDLSCTNCTNPVATPFQSAVYYVTGTTNGCSASDSVKMKVQTKEALIVQPNTYSVCQGDSVVLNASGTDNYSWSPSNTLSNATIKNPTAFPLVNTAYMVTGKDSHNCFSDTAAVNVTVNPNPTVNITDSVVQVLTGSTYNILVTASIDAQNFEWLPPTGLSCYTCLQPVATVNKNITYTLNATNEFGCSDSDNITIISVCTGEAIYLPNTFSPNNDGMNDYFYPRSSAGITIKSLTIFNRWGQMIFQKRNFSSNNFTDGWDGKYKNNLQNADVYVYIMELQCEGSSTVIKKGNISLLR